MGDTLCRAIANSGRFFAVACRTTELVAEACASHDAGPVAAAALGRSLTGAALLAALLKQEQSIRLKFKGSGPLGAVIAEAGSSGWVRGHVNHPHADLPLRNGRIDVSGGIGLPGTLTLTKVTGENHQYPGSIALVSAEIGDDLAAYLTHSEQTPSTLGLSVSFNADGKVLAAGGFLVQSLPPADEQQLTAIEAAMAKLAPLSKLLSDQHHPRELLALLFAAIPHHVTAENALYYSCSCSRQKMEAALLALGPGELQQLAKEQQETEVSCQFCRRRFLFTQAELLRLLSTPQLNSPGGT